MGIPEMMAQSQDGGGMEGFFNSPIAMILMPRTAARFQEAKKQQILLDQYNRKVQLAGQFADQIEGQDPQAAAMIRADPSSMDNVWTAWYNAGKQKELAGVNFQNDLLKQQQQAELAIKQKRIESNMPGGPGNWETSQLALIQGEAQPSGVMSNPKVQGPRTAGELQQGQKFEDFTMPQIAAAVSDAYKMPGLPIGDALRIMKQPGAPQEIATARAAVVNREDMQQAEIDKIGLQYDNEVEKTLEGRKYAEKQTALATAKAKELATTFFGSEPTSTVDSAANQTLKWRDYFQDPKITATEARQLTTAFAGGLSGEKPDQNAALKAANEQYGKLRPVTSKVQNVPVPGQKFDEANEENMAKVTVPDAIAAGQKAAGAALDLTILKSALKTAPQGWNPEALVASYVNGYSGPADTVTALVNTMVPKLHEPGSGATSDLEFSSFRAALPQLMKTPDGNQAIVAIMERKNDLVLRRAKIAGDMRAKRISPMEGAAALTDLDQESLITPELEETLAKAGVQISATGETANGDAPALPQAAKDAKISQKVWEANPQYWDLFKDTEE